jgi:hypothetical protein
MRGVTQSKVTDRPRAAFGVPELGDDGHLVIAAGHRGASTSWAPWICGRGCVEAGRRRHAAIRHLLAEGRSVRAIGLELGLARNTVRRFARAGDPEELLVHDGTGQRPGILEEYRPYLRQRWNVGCTDAALLWQEIRAQGCRGSYSLVRDYLAPLRGTMQEVRSSNSP